MHDTFKLFSQGLLQCKPDWAFFYEILQVNMRINIQCTYSHESVQLKLLTLNKLLILLFRIEELIQPSETRKLVCAPPSTAPHHVS